MYKKDSGKIKFYIKSDELFNDVSLLSSYMTKNVRIDGGSALDEFIISEDEKDVYDVCVEQTMPYIYEVILKMTSGVNKAFDKTVGEISFSVLDNSAYNENTLTLVDATIRDCMKYGVLAEFYSINTNVDLYSMAKAKHSEMIRLLQARLFQLKKKSISSQLK
jgi:hypothetical protein